MIVRPLEVTGLRARSAQYVVRRFHERRRAAGQLCQLARYGGPRLVAGILVLNVVAGLLPICFMVAVGVALGHLVAPGHLVHGTGAVAGTTWWYLTAALTAFVAHQALGPAQYASSQALARRIDAACISRFTHVALRRTPLAVLECPAVADRLSDVERAFEQLTLTPGAAAEGALSLVTRYTQLLGAVIAAAVTAGGWAAVAAGLVGIVLRRGHSAAFHRWGQRIRALAPLRRRAGYVRELSTSTRAAKEIRALGLIDWVENRYVADNRAALEPLWRWRRGIYGPPFALYLLIGLAGLATALVLSLGGAARSPSVLAVGVQAIVVCARFGVMFPEADVKMVYGRTAWEELLEFEHLATTAAAARPTDRPGARRPLHREIAFRDVSFWYDPRRPVLSGVDLVLAAGTSTALVGLNGAGKTTFVKLLTGMYPPVSGQILVDGVDVRDLDPAGWRRTFAVTFQDFVRYELSLRDNVAMGAIEHRHDDAGLTAELRRVGLADLLSTLEGGLDSPLTTAVAGGRDLSGGEWQRIALARALFGVRHGARVLILDEPAAALDARGEAQFYDMFLELTRGVTSLLVSHRFSSVRRADRIAVLDAGHVVEYGTHDDLVAARGTYARLFGVQARRFVQATPRTADGAA